MAARKKKATKKVAKKATRKRAPVKKPPKEPEAAGAQSEEGKPEAAPAPPPPPPKPPEAPAQAKAADADADRVWRILVQVDNALYHRLRAIAQRENAAFPADEELSIAQQAAVLLEGGITLWEEDNESARDSDAHLEDPEYAEALSVWLRGITA